MATPPEPVLTCVILEFHDLDAVAPCIASLRRAGIAEPEIIVSSNSCYPPEVRDTIVAADDGARWIFNPSNGGFAAGMNAGLRAARGQLVVLANADVRWAEGSLSGMEAWFRDHPRAGLVGPRCLGPDGTQQDCARPFMGLGAFIRRQARRLLSGARVLPERGFDYTLEQQVDWVLGGCMIARRGALASAGLLDEGYFLYVEDMDWCKRFWDAGWEVWYVPAVGVTFAADRKSTACLASPGRPNRYAWMHLCSYLRFLRKHGPFPRRPAP